MTYNEAMEEWWKACPDTHGALSTDSIRWMLAQPDPLSLKREATKINA